jgi:hypothetical protein
MTKLAVGDLIARTEAPTVLYRVTSKQPHQCFRLLPYQRSGREIWITKLGGNWIGDGSTWKRIKSER